MGELADFRVELLRPADDIAVVEAAGELDLHTSPVFKDSLVGALVGGARRSAEVGSELMIVCPAGSVARVIEITGLNRAFAMYATREEALGAGADGTAE